MGDYERVLCVKNEVFVFKIPPRSTNRGHKASDWQLENPDWTGRLRIVAKGKDLSIKLEDKTSGELFAQAPVDSYPGVAVEAVSDSSRYFVIQIQDPSGKKAFIGMGFTDRGDSFDLNVALQDHFKHIKQEKDMEQQNKAFFEGPKLDLGFKEGETIRINIGSKKEGGRQRPRPAGAQGGSIPTLLPPPPGGAKITPRPVGAAGFPPPPAAAPVAPQATTQGTSSLDLLGGSFSSNPSTAGGAPATGGAGGSMDLLPGLDPFSNPQPQSQSSSGQTQDWVAF